MVGIVEESCKRAIDQSNPSEVEIDIDSLDLQTFLKLNKYVEECIKVRHSNTLLCLDHVG